MDLVRALGRFGGVSRRFANGIRCDFGWSQPMGRYDGQMVLAPANDDQRIIHKVISVNG